MCRKNYIKLKIEKQNTRCGPMHRVFYQLNIIKTVFKGLSWV